MHITFWGTRGSIAKPGPTTQRYGGNTSCVEVRSRSGALLVIDGGTGAHGLGQALVASETPVNGSMLISHTHWDHIQGIPFFAPFFVAGSNWDIYGPGGLSESLRATLAGQMEYAYFPITPEQFSATIRYHDLVEGEFSIGEFRIVARYLNHPALTLGYRIEVDGATVAYCCDHEPHSSTMASGEVALTGMDRRYAEFVAGADLVVHDSQYTAREYPDRIGWGHSPVEYAVRVCEEAGVRRLALTHYDPLRDDAGIDRILAEVRAGLLRRNSSLDVVAAAEGMRLDVSGTHHGDAPASAHAHQYGATMTVDATALTRVVLLHLPEGDSASLLRAALESEGLPYRVVTSVPELQHEVLTGNPSLVLLGHQPPERDGLKVAAEVRRSEGNAQVRVPIVLVSDDPVPAEAGNLVATDWLVAPFSASYARTKLRAWVLRAACRWVRARLPSDEASRLGALRKLGILDTPEEQRFDRLTRIAAAAMDVPIALVSLVDSDRQWFKSGIGFDLRDTPRDVAFCAHVVQEKAELSVLDTLLDDRFADNPLVTGETRIRSYTGVPLTLADGSCIGTLCVIDTRPRSFGAAEMATLRDIRDLVLRELTLPAG